MYSEDSTLISISNLKERKLEAAKKAGLSPTDDFTIDVMELKNDDVNELIFHFQSYYQYDNAFQQLCTDQQLFWDIQEALAKRTDETDLAAILDSHAKKAKASEFSNDLRKRINALMSEIYKTEDEIEMAATFIPKILSPEQRIREMQKAS